MDGMTMAGTTLVPVPEVIEHDLRLPPDGAGGAAADAG